MQKEKMPVKSLFHFIVQCIIRVMPIKSLFILAVYVLLYSCATTPDPDSIKQSEAYFKLAVAYLNNDQLSEAFIEFQKSIKLNPGNKESLNYLGYISSRFRKNDEAISYYKRAIAVDPDYSEAMNNLGVVYLELESWNEAIKYFRSAVKNPVYRTPEKAYANMGYAYYKVGNFQMAESALKEALVRNPLFTHAIYTLGLVYVKLGNNDGAIKEFEKATGIIPDYIEAHWELANAYLRAGENVMALDHLRIVAAKDNDKARSRKALELINLLKK